MPICMCVSIVLLILIAGGSTTAQRNPDAPPAITARIENGETIWQLSARATVRLPDLMKLYAEYRGMVAIFDDRKVSGDLRIERGQKDELRGSDIDVFVASAFDEFRLCVIESAKGVLKVVPAVEAMTVAPFVPAEEIDKVNPGYWVTMSYTCKNGDAHDAIAAINRGPPRAGSSALAAAPMRTLLWFGRAGRLVEELKLIRQMDEAGRTTVRAFDLPEGADVDESLASLRELFRDPLPRPVFAILNSSGRVLVRARAEDFAAIETAIAALR